MEINNYSYNKIKMTKLLIYFRILGSFLKMPEIDQNVSLTYYKFFIFI